MGINTPIDSSLNWVNYSSIVQEYYQYPILNSVYKNQLKCWKPLVEFFLFVGTLSYICLNIKF